MPRSFVAMMSGAMIHIAVPRSDTSTSAASPVRSRWKSAAATPPATVMPPAESPKAARCMTGAAAPAGVGLLAHEVAAAGGRDEAGGHEPALRVAARRVLDLDPVGAPAGEHGARRRHEPPLRDLDDAHAREDLAHPGSLPRRAWGPPVRSRPRTAPNVSAAAAPARARARARSDATRAGPNRRMDS